MNDNIILLTDSYKATHWKQYPPKTENVYSYFESRGGEFDQTVFFGLQYILKKYLVGPVVTKDGIDEAEKLVAAHFGTNSLFNRAGWEYILEKHGGKLPISIRAVPEGTRSPVLTPLMTVENTDKNCFWLTNYLETLLVQVWYPTTVATLSREIKKVILRYLQETGDTTLIDFKLHDFGFRGVSSVESSGIGGLAHLVNFKGTDTMASLITARDYYGCPIAGFSIPAAEHSTITSWGRSQEGEAFKNMLTQFPTGLVAVVSDSYDIFKACRDLWGGRFKKLVLERDGCLVIRPDSGDPVQVIMDVLFILGDHFGFEVNSKGYRVLNPRIRIIQGDGVDLNSISDILSEMEKAKWSADNIAFGMGGGLLQKLNRDTMRFAFKCSSIIVNGEARDVFKSPVTSPWKVSKAGRFNLAHEVFRDGELLVDQTLDEIRGR